MASPTTPTAAASGSITIGGDLTVHRLGFGAMRITGNGIWGPSRDHDEAVRTLRRAVELGVTFIDTADSYGPNVSEELIHEALYPYPQGLVIATKGGLTRTGPNQWPPDGRPQHLREALEGSMKRLCLERIDLYQFHRPDPKVPYEDSIGELKQLQAQGKIRHIGVSNVTPQQLAQAQKIVSVVSVQNRYNLGDRASEGVIDICTREGLAFLPWAPIVDTRASQINEIARLHNATPRQIALAWLLMRSPIVLPIPGTATVSHLEENIAAASVKLSQEEYDVLAQSAAH